MINIGVTMGDPAGIGPEIVAKSLTRSWENDVMFTLIGNRENFDDISRRVGLGSGFSDKFEFVDIPGSGIEYGKVKEESGRIALRSIEEATKMALHGELTGISTAPVNKEALLLAGSSYKDHTDMLKALTNSQKVSTVFVVRKLRIIFMTKHVSLLDACRSVRKGDVMEIIAMADQALKALGIKNGKIGVAALNPHSGENGLFGREEIDEIIPAINEAKPQFNVSGPYPADSIFHQAAGGKFDIVVSLYHDQGHIAAKMYDFDRTVSMNIGLPFLRTSVDHGTAFDIAGKNMASEVSMIEALKKSVEYSSQYRNFMSGTHTAPD